MKDIINWLINIERIAHELYSKAAEVCNSNKKFSDFLLRIAEEEVIHYHIMNSASNHLGQLAVPPHQLILDGKAKSKVETLFSQMELLLIKNSFDETKMMNCIVDVELSEWNDIFVYVVNVLKSNFTEFKNLAPKIQLHIGFIENFCELNEKFTSNLSQIRQAPKIWEEKILIVEDYQPLREVFKDVLEKFGSVDTAANGEIALEMALKQYYSFILSDIDIPVLNGIEFYKLLIEKYPDAKNRFVFMSGDFSNEHLLYFKEKGLMYKLKPIAISDIKKMVLESFGIN